MPSTDIFRSRERSIGSYGVFARYLLCVKPQPLRLHRTLTQVAPYIIFCDRVCLQAQLSWDTHWAAGSRQGGRHNVDQIQHM